MTLVLDGWENVNHEHLVNFLVTIGDMTLFLDSKMIGATNQCAENQATMVQSVLQPYGGVHSFAAVTSDNTASCLNMRDIVSNRYPGLVSLNDQAHVANLLFSDVCKVKIITSAVDSCSIISSFIRNHQYVNALYKICKQEFNETLKQRQDKDTATAVNFSAIPATRFGYRLNAIEEYFRNQKACLDLIFDQQKLEKAVNSNTTTKKEAYSASIKTVESRNVWKSMATAVKVLTTLRIYLRHFDTDTVDIRIILRETKAMRAKMEKELGKLISAVDITLADKNAVLEAVDTCINGPISGKIKVTLLTNIHFLVASVSPAASVSPETPAEDFFGIIPRAKRAFQKFLVNSPGIFSKDELSETKPEERVAEFHKQLLMFVGGNVPSILIGREEYKAIGVVGREEYKAGFACVGGFWKVYGHEINFLKRVGMWISHLSPSSCPAERSFSAQKLTHSLKRNRLQSEKVRKLTFSRCNLRLFDGLSPHISDSIDSLIDIVDEYLSKED